MKPFEDDAALARCWLSKPHVGMDEETAAGRVVSAAAARGNDEAVWLSEGLEAVAVGLSWRHGQDKIQQHRWLVERLQRLRVHGTPRAVQLAEAALAMRFGHGNDDLDAILASMRRHGPAEADFRPPIERVWTDAALCGLVGERGQYDEALAHGLQADRAARQSGNDGAISAVAQLLGFVFLSTGDVEGALGVLPVGIEAASRFGRSAVPQHYNLLLAWCVSGRWDEAAAWIDAHPWLLDAKTLTELPVLNAVLAAVLAAQGQFDRIDALMQAELPDIWARPAILANQAWLFALVELAAGAPAAARQRIERFLDTRPKNAPLSSMNATQLHDVLSRACEALGDEGAALRALKLSRDACFSWVAESMRARLQVLDRAARGANPGAQHRSHEAIETKIQQLRAERAEAALARSERYFSLAVHDLRTPVSGLVGLTSLLSLSRLDQRQRRYVDLAQNSAAELLSLCNDLLDLARIRAGHFQLKPVSTDVAALVELVTAAFEASAVLSGLRLSCRVAPNLPLQLQCDGARLRQILSNLLSNAIKFTRAGSVQVDTDWAATASDRGELLIAVRDTGPGLTAEEQARLFEDFSQFDADAGRRAQGIGLGLATCRELAEIMGGRIEVRSTAGQGSCFTLRLPLSPAASGR